MATIFTADPVEFRHLPGAANYQLRLSADALNFTDLSTSAAGVFTITPSGASMVIAKPLLLNDTLAVTGAATFRTGNGALSINPTTGTDGAFQSFVSDGGSAFIGTEGSIGGAIVTGSTAFALAMTTAAGKNFFLGVNGLPGTLAMQIINTGAVTFPFAVTCQSTLTSIGLLSADAGILLDVATGNAAGKINYNTVDGLVIWPTGGTNNDLLLANGAGAAVMIVATGTQIATFPGSIESAGGVTLGTTVTLTEGIANRLDLAAGDSFNIVSGTLTVGGAASITGIVTSPIGSAWRLGQDAVTAHLVGNVGSVGLTIADGGGISGVFVDNSHNGTFSAQAILFKVAEGGVTATFEAARVSKRGNFLIGTTSDPTANDSKVLVLGDNTADPTFAAGTAGLWNNGGTLKTAGTFQADSLLLGTTVVLSEGIANRLDLVAGDSFNIVNGNLTVGGITTLVYDSGATVPLTFVDSNAGGETWRAGSGINALTSFGWFNVDQSLPAMTLSNAGVLSVNQLDGPSGNHLILNAPATAGFILMQNQGVETLRLGPDGSVAFPRVGPHAIGGVIDNRIGLLVGGAITSVGSGIGVGTALQHALTGAPGDIQSLAMVHIRGNINTQTATESIGIVASLLVDDPLIINNLTGTIPVAASIYIKAAPTEGVVNAALFIAGGSLDIGTTSLFEGAADRLDLASGDSFLAVNGSINIGALVAGFDFALSLDGAGAPRGMMIRNTGTAAGDDARLVFETQASRTMGMGLDRSTGLFAFAGNADLVTSLAMTIDPLNGNMKTFGDHLVAGNLGLFGGAAVAKPTGVTVDIAAVHAALITLNLIGV